MASINLHIALSEFCQESDRPRNLLQDAGFNIWANPLGRRLQKAEMVQMLGDADAVIAGLEPYDGEVLVQLPRLRCISRCGVGTDSIDLERARQRQVSVFTTVNEVVEPVAQMSIAMILALARNLCRHSVDMSGGKWERYTASLLSEWTVGIVGFGRIGRLVERYLRPFRPRVIIFDPFVDPLELPEGVGAVSISELLAEADLVSLHASRDPSEGPILGTREIAQMKPGSRLVNTARGHLVDEAALYDALKSGYLSGAALDVYVQEPYRGGLSSLPQVLCTPHVATFCRASRNAMELECALNVVKFFTSEREKLD